MTKWLESCIDPAWRCKKSRAIVATGNLEREVERLSKTFAIHIEGESESANLRELTDNFLQTIRAAEKTVVRAATFSDHATSAEEGKSTLNTSELQPTLDEKALFEAGHRKPAPAEETAAPEPSAA